MINPDIFDVMSDMWHEISQLQRASNKMASDTQLTIRAHLGGASTQSEERYRYERPTWACYTGNEEVMVLIINLEESCLQ